MIDWQGFMGCGIVVEFTTGPYLILIAFGVPRELLKLWDLSLTKIIKFYIENVFRQNSLFIIVIVFSYLQRWHNTISRST